MSALKTTALIGFAAMMLAAPAAFAYQSGYGEHRVHVCGLRTVRTDPVPGNATVRIKVFANGREIQGVALSPHAFQWMGRGVAVLARSRVETGPMRFRIANLRDVCSRVRVTYRWQSP